MPCKYFRYIDIEAVYQQLGTLTSESEYLGNIPFLFIENVSTCFEQLAFDFAYPDDDDPLVNIPSAELAATVSKLIEESLEGLSAESGQPLPAHDGDCLDRVFDIECLAVWESFQENDLARKLALVCFEYDTLCWLYELGEEYSAFAMTQVITRSYSDLERCYALQSMEWERRKSASLSARERAIKRHSATNEQKFRLLKEWSESSAEYQSRADFCRIISQREGMLYRTLYEWIARYDNANKTSL